MGRAKRIWYLSPMRAAKVQASLRIRAVSPEPPLLAHTSSESRGTFRQKTRSLAPLNGWACAVKVCHDGMLEDTNSLGGAHMIHFTVVRGHNIIHFRGVDRKICPKGHCFSITRIPRDRFVSLHLTPMIDSYSWIPFSFQSLILSVAFSLMPEHTVNYIWCQCNNPLKPMQTFHIYFLYPTHG